MTCLRIATRFQGPRDSGNGGYVCSEHELKGIAGAWRLYEFAA